MTSSTTSSSLMTPARMGRWRWREAWASRRSATTAIAAMAAIRRPATPNPSPDLLHNHIARHFEDEISPIKGAEREAVRGGGDAEVVPHRQCREADVYAVDICQ